MVAGREYEAAEAAAGVWMCSLKGNICFRDDNALFSLLCFGRVTSPAPWKHRSNHPALLLFKRLKLRSPKDHFWL